MFRWKKEKVQRENGMLNWNKMKSIQLLILCLSECWSLEGILQLKIERTIRMDIEGWQLDNDNDNDNDNWKMKMAIRLKRFGLF